MRLKYILVVVLTLLGTQGHAQIYNPVNGTGTFSNVDKVVYVDGVTYAYSDVGVQAAINAACTGNVPGKVVLPPQTITAISTQIAATSSNCTIEGAGKYVSVLKASSTYSGGGVFGTNTSSHVRLVNFGVDGNRSDNGGTNANTFDCLDIGSSSIDVLVDNIRVSNCRNNGITVASSDADITVMNTEADHNGNGNIAVNGTAGINVAAATGTELRIHLGPHDRIHDNNGGVIVSNSTNSANLVSDVSVLDDIVFANGNDAILITASNPSGGKIVNVSVIGNQAFCNGDSTSLFPAACTAGFYQTHANNSPGGVAVDLITNANQLLVQPTVANNSSHDNTFEGIAVSSNIAACVTVTTLTTVTQSSAAACGLTANQPFQTNWKAGQPIAIAAVLYRIASVSSSTVLTLTDNAVNGAGQTAGLSTYMWAIVEGNSMYNEGNNSLAGGVGPGIFCQQSDGNSFMGNSTRLNNFEGLELDGCSFSSVIGDRAYSNDVSNTANRNYGFVTYAGLGNQFIDDIADDPGAIGHQTVGIFIDSKSTNTIIQTSSIYGTVAPYTNNGLNTQVNDGTTIITPGGLQFTSSFTNPSGTTSSVYNQSGVGVTLSGLNVEMRGGVAPTRVALFRSGGGMAFPEIAAPSTFASEDLCYGDSTAHALKCSYNNGTLLAIPQVIASSTSAMTTASILTGACGTTVTTAATGVATTDTIEVTRNAAATIANGGGLTLNSWPTSGNVNFNYCNSAAGTITPTAMTVNWRVVR